MVTPSRVQDTRPHALQAVGDPIRHRHQNDLLPLIDPTLNADADPQLDLRDFDDALPF